MMNFQSPNVHYIQETTSTNEYLSQWIKKEVLDEFTVVYTDKQTAGKGQRGNYWESEEGANLTFSFLLRPTFMPIQNQFELTKLVSLSIVTFLRKLNPLFTIKWPNDIYWTNYKMGGILIENEITTSCWNHAIVGIGFNVNQLTFRSDAPNPISLSQLVDKKQVNKEWLFSQLMEELISHYEALKAGNTHFLELYSSFLFRNKGSHLYRDKEGLFKATFQEVLPNGRLVLRTNRNKNREYAFKEVQFVL